MINKLAQKMKDNGIKPVANELPEDSIWSAGGIGNWQLYSMFAPTWTIAARAWRPMFYINHTMNWSVWEKSGVTV